MLNTPVLFGNISSWVSLKINWQKYCLTSHNLGFKSVVFSVILSRILFTVNFFRSTIPVSLFLPVVGGFSSMPLTDNASLIGLRLSSSSAENATGAQYFYIHRVSKNSISVVNFRSCRIPSSENSVCTSTICEAWWTSPFIPKHEKWACIYELNASFTCVSDKFLRVLAILYVYMWKILLTRVGFPSPNFHMTISHRGRFL